jgi:hypothetical protein
VDPFPRLVQFDEELKVTQYSQSCTIVVIRIMRGLALSVYCVWMYGRPDCNTSTPIDCSTYATLYDYG